MTPERKAEVNRRLAELDGWRENTTVDFLPWWTHPDRPPEAQALRLSELPNYTADLNALTRLEAKLPLLHWSILHDGGWTVRLSVDGNDYDVATLGSEAEARTEAICQYLESQ